MTTQPTTSAPDAAADPFIAAEAAADLFTAALNQQVSGQDAQLGDALPLLLLALESVADSEVVDEVRRVVDKTLEEYALNARLMGERHARDVLGNGSRTWPIEAAIDAAIVRYDDAPLKAAREQVASLVAEQAQLMTQIEAAVEQADLDEVMRLRGGALVTLPAKIADARTRVLEQELSRAEAALKRPSARLDESQREAAEAEAEVTELRERVAAAEKRHAAALLRARRDWGAAEPASKRMRAAQAALAAHNQEAHAAERQQVRRLAGLVSTTPQAIAAEHAAARRAEVEAAQRRYESLGWPGGDGLT